MAFSTFAELKAAILDTLHRSDDIGARVEDWIAAAEDEMNRQLRVGQMEARGEATIDAEFIALPEDFLGARSLTLRTSPVRALAFQKPDDIAAWKAAGNSATGVPQFYGVVGESFQFAPAPDGTYTGDLVYYARIPALSDARPTNWVLRYHRDAYLYGALVHSAPYLGADERAQTWGSFFDRALQGIRNEDTSRRYGNRLSMSLRTFG